jgi:prevent-host-death family protein
MKVYNYSEARQNFSTVLNTALKEEVIISRKDGNKFKIISMRENKKRGKSPLEDIKGIKANVSMDDILDAIRESRKR